MFMILFLGRIAVYCQIFTNKVYNFVKKLCVKVGISGAGALSVLVMGFSAGIGWRAQGWEVKNPVSK